MNLDQIPKSVDDRGLALTISIMLLIGLALAGYLFFIYMKKKVESTGDVQNPMTHPLFASIKRNLSFFIPSLPIDEPLRCAIFRDFLMIKFTVIGERFRDIAAEKGLDSLTSAEFSNKISALIIQIVEEYEAKVLKEGIPDVVIKKFREWHDPNVSHLINFAEETCRADWYRTNTQRLNTIMDFISSLLNRTLLDAEHTLKSLNGQLDPVVYKGITSQRKQGEH